MVRRPCGVIAPLVCAGSNLRLDSPGAPPSFEMRAKSALLRRRTLFVDVARNLVSLISHAAPILPGNETTGECR